MRYAFSLLALCLLPACLGGGGGGGGPTGPTIPTDPTTQLNNDFGTLLNGVRMNGDVMFNSDVQKAAQAHASDMVVGEYFGHLTQDPAPECGTPCDAGERLLAEGYQWDLFFEGIARGDTFTLEELRDAWAANGGGNDDISVFDGDGSTTNIDAPGLEHFGIAKAGSGSGQRWVLVLADPKVAP